jgi:hypothetical protein
MLRMLHRLMLDCQAPARRLTGAHSRRKLEIKNEF